MLVWRMSNSSIVLVKNGDITYCLSPKVADSLARIEPEFLYEYIQLLLEESIERTENETDQEVQRRYCEYRMAEMKKDFEFTESFNFYCMSRNPNRKRPHRTC